MSRYLALVEPDLGESLARPGGLARMADDGSTIELLVGRDEWREQPALIRFVVLGESGAEDISETAALRLVRRWPWPGSRAARRAREAAMLGADFDESKVTRDESGKFSSGGGGATGTAERGGGKAAAADVTRIATSRSWGAADPPGTQARWGQTSVSVEEHNAAKAETIAALNAQGLNGEQIENGAQGWGFGVVDSSFETAVGQGSVSGDFFRGVALPSGAADALTPGATFQTAIPEGASSLQDDGQKLSSWSRDSKVAGVFADVASSAMWEGEGDPVPVMLHVTGEAMPGLDVAVLGPHEFAWQAETVMASQTLTVTDVASTKIAVEGEMVDGLLVELRP